MEYDLELVDKPLSLEQLNKILPQFDPGSHVPFDAATGIHYLKDKEEVATKKWDLNGYLDHSTIRCLVTRVRGVRTNHAYDTRNTNSDGKVFKTITNRNILAIDPKFIQQWTVKKEHEAFLRLVAKRQYLLYPGIPEIILGEVLITDQSLRIKQARQTTADNKYNGACYVLYTTGRKGIWYDITFSSDPPLRFHPTDPSKMQMPRPTFSCALCHSLSLATSILKRCGRCKAVYYCGQECQRQDWKANKRVCALN